MNSNILNAVLTRISETESFDELGRVIVKNCADQFNAEVCSIWRRFTDDRGAHRLRLLAASAKAPQTLAEEVIYEIRDDDIAGLDADGITGYVAQTRQEVHVASFEELKREYGFCWQGKMDKPQWGGKPGLEFRSLSAVPLLLGDRLVGVLKLENKRQADDGFPQSDRQTLRELAPWIALAVHGFGLLERDEERLIQVPAKMVETLLGPFETKQLVSEIVKTAAESLHAEICSLWLVDPGRNELRLADGVGFPTQARAEQTYHLTSSDVPDSKIEGITAWVAIRKKPFWANSWDELKAHDSHKGKWDEQMWHNSGRNFRCLYATPLIRQDSAIGVLKVENRIGAAFFTNSDRVLCGIMASLIVLVLDLGQQLRTTLISDLAHLIRSPIGQVPVNLRGVEDELKKLQKGEQPQLDRIAKYVDFIKKAVLAVTVTSRTLAAFAQRASYLATDYPTEKVSLVNLINSRLGEIKPLLYSGITMHADFANGVQSTTVDLDITDHTRLQIVIDNIVHNAIKYSKPNDKVEIKLNKMDDTVILTIQDFGEGIAEDDLLRIYDPGFTKRAKGHAQGTGMGLTTVKQILDRLSWKFDVVSKVGQGTIFRIVIPIKEGA